MSDDYAGFTLSRAVDVSSIRSAPGDREAERKVIHSTAPRRDEAIEPGRLRRAMKLLPFVEQIGPRDFYVKGNDEPMYHVSLDTNPPCYCRDAEMRGMQCKHELCCRLRLFEPQVVKAMADVIEIDQRNLAQALRRTKRRKRTV